MKFYEEGISKDIKNSLTKKVFQGPTVEYWELYSISCDKP